MAAITVSAFNPIFDNAQVPPKMFSAPVAADLAKGTAVKFNATTGRFEAMAAADGVHLFAGLLTKDTKQGYMGTAFRGLAYMTDISGLDVGELITLNTTTAGALDDAQTGTVVARVVPIHKVDNAFEKLVEIFDLPFAKAT